MDIVIMAGGRGQCFQLSSTEDKTKQFLELEACGRSLLQQTYDRMIPLTSPEKLFVATATDYLDLVKDQLPELPESNILVEPVGRDSAAIAASLTIEQRSGNITRVLLMGDDHASYLEINAALEGVSSDIQLDHVAGSAAAWQAFQADQYDVYLLVAAGSSLDLLARLKEARLERAVVVLTTEEDAGVERRVRQAGAADYLVKGSFDTALLQRVLRSAAERQSILERLHDSEARYELAVSAANEGIWDWNLSKNQIFFSARWKEQLGYGDEDLPNNLASWFDHVHSDDVAGLRNALDHHLNDFENPVEYEYRIYHKNGDVRWMRCRALTLYQAGQKRMAGWQTDISKGKEMKAQILNDAYHDPLTMLANRAFFINRITQLLALKQAYEGYDFAIILLDIDRFKIVNDSLGYEIGDKLIGAIAERLKGSLRPDDSVARLGGDEFAILVEKVVDYEQVAQVAERLQGHLAHSFPLGVRNHVITASVGIMFYSQFEAEDTADILLRNAEIAMYRAKAVGGNAIEVYEATMHTVISERLQLESDLREAIEQGTLSLNYQPIVDLNTQHIVAFEALARWTHPERGFISPGEFIPIAEEAGLIVPLGYWVLEQACREAIGWKDRDGNPLSISVNLSSRQFSDPILRERIEHILDVTYFDPSRLRLEITETAIMENSAGALDIIKALKSLGIKMHMDDFGTGYSSLSYLHRFPLDTLKIDRSFVMEMDHDESLEIIKSIIVLAKNLDLDIIAEGIEQNHHVDQLLAFGCPSGQGFLFSQPVASGKVEALLEMGCGWQ